MRKHIRLVTSVILFFFALLCSYDTIHAEQKRDGYVEDMFVPEENVDQNENSNNTNNNENKETETKDDTVADNKVTSTIGQFAKMILALIFVIGLLYLTLKIINKRSRSYRNSQLIENIGGTSLGTNRSVQMIKVGERILIVGVGDNIELLTEITSKEEYDNIISDYNEKIDQFSQPTDIFSKLFNKTKNNEPEQQVEQFETMLRNEFKEIRAERQNMYKELEKKGTDG